VRVDRRRIFQLIHVKNLCKSYKTYNRGTSFLETTKSLFVRKTIIVEAVKDISFDVEKAEILGFIGPNGAGKSTTLKMLTGILYPTSGEASIMGYTPWRDRKKYVSNIGAVFGQKSQLMWDIPPVDSFYLNKAIYGIESKLFNQTLSEMVELLDIGDVIKKPTRQLSLGERMKCEFVMAMLHSPKIMFLDEPTIGLDVLAKDVIREFILSMNKKGTTFILTTHDISDIEKLASRVMIVNHGEIAFNDSIDVLKGKTSGKKTIKIITQNHLSDMPSIGVEASNIISMYEGEFTINQSEIALNDFITMMNERFGIKDIQIEELHIEAIIKQIYK
jgi:ABC-2 type transport system ATP-binding protein